MAYRRYILDEAKREYQDIVAYMVEVLKSPQAALNFLAEFDHQLELISDNPEIFALSRMPELAAKGYRVAFINNYVMLYKAVDNCIFVVHVFHQSQDYAKLV